MNSNELKEILRLHKLWCKDDGGRQANLDEADLRRADLRGAKLHEADLRRADLYGADLRGADLCVADLRGAKLHEAKLDEANLYGANLRDAYLHGADLRGADLHGANLHGANLHGANLHGANLDGANLHGANLHGADLRGANLPSPPAVLLAGWTEVSDKLCVELMRYDAINSPDQGLFDEWANGGGCPFEELNICRSAMFVEKKELWKPGSSLSAYELMIMVIIEKCKDSDYHGETNE